MSGWLIGTLVATTLLMVAVLALRPLVRKLFGSGAAYALWLIPAVRMVLPPITISSVTPPAVRPVEFVFTAAAPISNAASGVSAWLIGFWAAGALLFGAWHLVGYRRFLAGLTEDGSQGRAIRVVASDKVDGPAAFGFWTRRILVPHDFDTRFDASERALALRHEHVHHARGDLWANAAALGMLAVQWFNPIAYFAYRAFRDDQELSCDAAVITGAAADESAAYGRAMVKSAWGAAPFTICPMTRTQNLKRRLKMVKMHTKSVKARIGGMVAVGAIAVAGLTLTATSASAADPVITSERIFVERVAGKDGAEAAIAKFTKGKCGTTPMTTFKVGDANDGAGKPTETRFIMCNKDGATIGDRLTALEKARARIASSDSVDAENRAKVLQALDNAIAKMKATN